MKYNVIGLMSGTSLDGLDIAFCNFTLKNQKWEFNIIEAKTYFYNAGWKNKLINADKLSAFDFIKLHKAYGKYCGEIVNDFLKNINEKIDLIASHGHTIFHLPNEQINFQIGDAAFIAAKTGINTVSDFRTLDIALHGQGAPLVPIGDKVLFSDYDFCLNLGGFANISFNNNNNIRTAFDICPANMPLNELSNIKNLDYDKNGELGKKGKVSKNLLKQLNNIEYYKKKQPKSLGKEWYLSVFQKVLNNCNITFYDKIRTVYEHIAIQITNNFDTEIEINNKSKSVLITGGGAFNNFLIKLIKNKTTANIVIPKKKIVEYKEALIFAFLGVLRYTNSINSLSSVTGAKQDNCGGIVHFIQTQ